MRTRRVARRTTGGLNFALRDSLRKAKEQARARMSGRGDGNVKPSFELCRGKETRMSLFIPDVHKSCPCRSEPVPSDNCEDEKYLSLVPRPDDEDNLDEGGPSSSDDTSSDDNDDDDFQESSDGDDDSGEGAEDEPKSCKKNIFVTVEAGLFGGKKQAKSRLRLYLDEYLITSEDEDTRWLSLNVKELSNQDNLIVQYHFKVEATLQTRSKKKDMISFEVTHAFLGDDKGHPKAVLKKKLIQLSLHGRSPPAGVAPRKSTPASSLPSPPKLPIPGDLKVKVTVSPIFISTPCDPGVEGSVGPALKSMLVASENYADIKLESTDGQLFNAHKFILAARSPSLRHILATSAKCGGAVSSGAMKMGVNAETMRILLHWMYADELGENFTDNLVEGVFREATRFGMKDLVKALDRKVATMCNPENMVRLRKIVQPRKNEMPNAFKAIARVAKDFLGSLDKE